MKHIIGLFFLIVASLLGAQTARGAKTASAPNHRILAGAAVVSHYINNRPSPPVIFIDCNAGLNVKDVLNFVRVKPATGVLKPGNNSEVRGERLVDKETGQSCESFLVSLKEITDQQATFMVYWDGPNKEWTNSKVVVRLTKDRWEVIDDKVVLVP